MSIVKSYSKQNNTTYFYEQNYKWNPVTKRPEGTRRLIGKLDPETGLMVPTGKRGRPKKDPNNPAPNKTDERLERMQDQINELMRKNQELSDEVDRLKKENRVYEKKLDAVIKAATS